MPALFLLVSSISNFFPILSTGQQQLSLSRPLLPKWSYSAGSSLNLTPASDGEVVYVPLDNGTIVSLRVTDGELSWRSEIGGSVAAPPLADARGVYVASESFPENKSSPQANGALRALSRQNGVTLWMRTLPAPVRGSLAATKTILVGGTSDGRFYAIRKDDGGVLWMKQNASPFLSNPVIDANSVFVGDEQGNLIAINMSTGHLLWRYRTRKALRAAVAVAEGTIFAGSTDGFVYALDKLNGHLKWRVRTDAAVQSIQSAGKCLLTISLDNFVYCLSPRHGAKLWKRQLAGRVAANPLVINDGVLLSPLVGDECVILSLQDGKKVNAIFVGDDNNSEASPLLSGNLLLLPTRKGLVALTNQTVEGQVRQMDFKIKTGSRQPPDEWRE